MSKKPDQPKLTARQVAAMQKKQREGHTAPPTPEELAVIDRRRHRTIIVLMSFGLVFVIISLAILIPWLMTPRYSTRNLVARMTLSNGMVIEYEIFTEECPIASANFIFLAQNKFFDNTLIFDTTDAGYVRFGGYTDYTTHRETDAAFASTVRGISKTTQIDGTTTWLDKPFSYMLRKDTSAIADLYNDIGSLSFLYSDTSTEFQVCTLDGAPSAVVDRRGNTSLVQLEATAFGMAFGDKSIENLRRIAQMDHASYVPGTSHPIWAPPAEKIRIKKVELFNFREHTAIFERNFDFYTYIQSANNGSSAVSGWVSRGSIK